MRNYACAYLKNSFKAINIGVVVTNKITANVARAGVRISESTMLYFYLIITFFLFNYSVHCASDQNYIYSGASHVRIKIRFRELLW